MHEIISAVLGAGQGVTSGSQLLGRGVTRREVERAVGAGELVRIRRNCLVDGRLWRGARSWERHALRARAVVVGLGTQRPVALTHHSALAVMGIALHGVDDRVHLAHVGGGRGRTDTGVASHRPLAQGLTVEHDGLRLARPAVACLQVAAEFGGEAALVSADDALRRRLVRHEDLSAAMAEVRPGRWSREPAKMMALADSRVESAAESRARWAFQVLGFRQPTPQVEIRGPDGALVGRVDFLYEDLRLVIEIDGMGKYEDAGDLRAEKLREDRLRALGYEVVRLTWEDLSDPLVVRRKVLAGVARAAA